MIGKELISEFDRNSYVKINMDLSKEFIDNAMELFFDFCELSDEEKDQFFIDVPYLMEDGTEGNYSNDKGTTSGYVKKEKHKGALDNKEYFHFDKIILDKFENNEYKIGNVSREFLVKAKEIYEKVMPLLEEQIKIMDEEISGLYDWIFEKGTFDSNCTVRFLKYSTSAKGDFIAKGHFDKGILTMALSESHPGLRLGKNVSDLKEVTHKEKEAIIFPAINLNDIVSKEVIVPSWHDVIQKENKDNEITTRWALVVFTNPLYLKKTISHKDTHEYL